MLSFSVRSVVVIGGVVAIHLAALLMLPWGGPPRSHDLPTYLPIELQPIRSPQRATPAPLPPLGVSAPRPISHNAALDAEASAPPTVAAPLVTELAAAPVSSPMAQEASEAVELPSTARTTAHNPPPAYPPMSRRLNEQGVVVVRARVEVNGLPTQTEVQRSSGYARLDRSAAQAVLAWRFAPGKRNGQPEAMWVSIPFHFVLE